MRVNLDQNEVTALLQTLNWYIPQLREEIGSTEDYDARQSLQAQEEALNGIVSKLGGSASESNLSDIGADNPPWGD